MPDGFPVFHSLCKKQTASAFFSGKKEILAFIKSLTNLKSVKWFRDESLCPRDWRLKKNSFFSKMNFLVTGKGSSCPFPLTLFPTDHKDLLFQFPFPQLISVSQPPTPAGIP